MLIVFFLIKLLIQYASKVCRNFVVCVLISIHVNDNYTCVQVDAESNKELQQWNEILRTEVVKLCQENNFSSGFFEGNDTNGLVDAYELKVIQLSLIR